MSMKEIADKNVARGNVYTIYTIQMHTNKYTEHIPSIPTTTSMGKKG